MDKRSLKYTTTNRLRMIHALKLYYNRLHFYLINLPESKRAVREDLTKEATDTFMQIRDLEDRLENSIDKQYDEILKELEQC